MKVILHKSLAGISMIFILLSLSPIGVYAADNQQDFDTVKQRVNALQATDPSLPGTVSEQKGRVGTILSRLFDSDGKIGNIFLKILGSANDNEVMRWDATTGQMVGSQIIDNGTNIAVGTPTPNAKFTVKTSNGSAGSPILSLVSSNDRALRLLQPDSSDGNSPFIWFTNNSYLWRVDSTDALSINGAGRVGIGKVNATEALDVIGNGVFSGTVSGATPVTASNFTTKSYVDTAIAGSGGGKFVDGTNTDDAVYTDGNVGIGIVNPEEKLHIDGRILIEPGGGLYWNSSADNIQRTIIGTSLNTGNIYDINVGYNTGIQGDITFWGGGGKRAVIQRGTGNMGIGTDNPGEKLDVVGNGQFSGTVSAANPVAATDLTTKSYVDGAITAGVSGAGDDLGNHTATENIQLNNNWLSNDGGNEGIRVADNGRIGVGIANPQSTLSLNTDGNVELGFYGTAGASANITSYANAPFLIRTGNTQRLEFGVNNATNLLISPTGNIGIGTTSPTVALEVNGNVIATDPTENNHVATKVYVDNAITVASNNDINALSDGRTTVTNLFLGDGVGDSITTGNDNTAIGQFALQQQDSGTSNNTAVGRSALQANLTGDQNTAVGGYALGSNTEGRFNSGLGYNALSDNTTGDGNVAIGTNTLTDNTTGSNNIALGRSALARNTTSSEQVAVGYIALNNNTTGYANVAVGARSLQNNTTGYSNVAVGQRALINNTTGPANTAIGTYALQSNTTAGNNTAVGYHSLRYNTTGAHNTAVGRSSLQTNTTGTYNISVGNYSLLQNTTGNNNNALGYTALYSNTTGVANLGIGTHTLYRNTTGNHNVGIGYVTLYDNTTGQNNVALGSYALQTNTTGNNNTALGYHNLRYNTTGSQNTAIGYAALDANTTAANNTALGYYALSASTTGAGNTGIGTVALDSVTTGNNNTGVGYNVLGGVTTGTQNTAIGGYVGDNITTGNNNIIIGYNVDAPSATASNQLNIGNTIYGNLGNDRVGIGVSSPQDTLHLNVIPYANNQDGGIRLSDSANNWNARIALKSNNGGSPRLAFDAPNQVEVISIPNTGNVGIGTNNPSKLLDVAGDTRFGKTNARHFVDIASSQWPEIRFTSPTRSGTMRFGMAHAASSTYQVSEGDLYAFSGTSGRMDLIVKRAGGVVLGATGGNVGIGVTNPAQKLDVNGNIQATGTVYAGASVYTQGAVAQHWFGSNSDGRLFLGAGRSTDGTRNSINLYNTGCTGGECNVPTINLYADNTNALGNLSVSGVVAAANPIASNHLTTKSYVDSAISAGGADNLGDGGATTGTLYSKDGNGYGYIGTDGNNYMRFDDASQGNEMYMQLGGGWRYHFHSNYLRPYTNASIELGGGSRRWSTIYGVTGNFSGNISAATFSGNGSGLTSLAGDNIADGTIDSSEIQDNTLTAADLAPNSVGDSEMIDNPTFSTLSTTSLIQSGLNSGGVALTVNDGYGNANITFNHALGRAEQDGNAARIEVNTDSLTNSTMSFELGDNLTSGVGTPLNSVMTLKSTGRLGIGTTDPSQALDVSGNARITGTVTAADPTASTHLTTKAYVDNLITQGVSWKAPVDTSAAATYGACDAAKEGWATYNKSDDIIYLCNASAWVNIGNSASVPYATTSTAGRVQLSGDIGGTWNNLQIGTAVVGSAEIANNSITETDISDSFVARNSNLLDGIDGSGFLRSNVNDNLTAAIIVPDANRNQGIFGTYNSTKTQHIWSMGTSYRNAADGSDFGNLYGLAYKHTNNPTGGNMAGGHQTVHVLNGSPRAAMGSDGLWTNSSVIFGAGANQRFYGDNNSAIYADSNNSSISQMIFRDLEDDTFGRVYGSQGDYFGLMDGDGNWAVQHLKDTHTMFAINNVEKARIDNTGIKLGGNDLDLQRGDTGQIRSVGMISFDWTGGTYDSANNHGITSKDEAGNFADDLRINSYSNIINTIDSNGNDGNSVFKIQKESSTDGVDLFTINESGNALITPTGTIPSAGIDSFALRTSGSYGGGIGLQDGAGNFGIWTDGNGANLRFGHGTNLGALTTRMSLTSVGDLSVTGRVSGATPTASNHLTTKAYVDALAGGGTNTNYLRSNASDDFTGGDLRIVRNTANEIETANDTSQFEIRQSSSTGDAYMTFHNAGKYAVNFGLDRETNELMVGGWSMGAAKYRILREGSSGDYIADGTIDSSEIQDNTLTASDLAPNSVGNSELIDSPTFVNPIVTGNLLADSIRHHDNGSGNVHIDAGSTSGTNRIYLNYYDGDGVNFGNGANGVVASVNSAGNASFATIAGNGSNITAINGDNITDGTVDGTEIQDNTLTASDLATNSVNAAEITDGQVRTEEIANNTITETDISDSFIARNSSLLGGYALDFGNSVNRVVGRNSSGDIYARLFRSTYGEQSSAPAATADIAFRNSTSDNYVRFMTRDAARAYLGVTTNTDTQNLSLNTTSDVLSLTNGGTVDFTYLRNGDTITDGTVDSSEIQDNTLTAADLAANSVGNSELADDITVTTMRAGTFLYTSDKRLKTNFQPIKNTKSILGLGTYRFDWKKDNSSDIGFIAQEVEEVFPEFVNTNEDGYKSVDYAKMVVPLLEVTKQQQQEIDELKAIVKQLQNK